MIIFVTGDAGCIGAHICVILLKAGAGNELGWLAADERRLLATIKYAWRWQSADPNGYWG